MAFVRIAYFPEATAEHYAALAEYPDHRLRLTLGLRKENGSWVVAHEHHSFPDRS